VSEAKKDPNYVVPISAPTKEARSAAAAARWKKWPAKKREKVVESCVEIKFRAPHAIDATLSPSLRLLDSLVDFHTGQATEIAEGQGSRSYASEVAESDDEAEEGLC
jgi:hypothetical protein